MAEKHTKGEIHGCVVCGKLYQLYVIFDESGKYIDSKVMSAGGKRVPHAHRPLVACDRHSDEEIVSAVLKAYGPQKEDDD